MKLTLLLIPILLLSSCSIDWNGEKDKKITELEMQLLKLRGEITIIEKSLSGAYSTIEDGRGRIKEVETELDAITGDTFTKLNERLTSDTTLEKNDYGNYEYKKEVFDGKNTGICYIGNNGNITTFEEAKQILEKCQPGNIVLEQGSTRINNCILSPNGVNYVYPSLSNDSQWKVAGEYYKITNKYVLFFNKRPGEYCNELIQINPSKFRTEVIVISGIEYEYGTDGSKFHNWLGVFDSKGELERNIEEYIKNEEIRMIEINKQNNINSR